MPRHRRALLICCSALAVGVIPAFAADPESGTVSNASPRVEWGGTTINGGATTIPAITNGGTVVCQAPSCDTFDLTLADTGDLTVSVSSEGTGGFLLLEIVKPDGEVVYNGGAENETSTTTKIKKAPAGAYAVRVAVNSLLDDAYKAFAQLGGAAPPAVVGGNDPKPPPSPDPQPTPVPGSGSQPAPASPAAVLSLNTKKLSARKVKRAPKFAVSTSSPVTEFTAVLKKGKKTLGKGKLAKLDSKATVKLKLKKALKKGSYTVMLRAKDRDGRIVGTTAKLKIVR